ncbi:MAG: TonB-dependent receptor [Ferruginibacter sp.]
MKSIFFMLIFFIPIHLIAQLNGTVLVSGKVVGENHEAIPSATVVLKGSVKGTLTDSLGKFKLVINQKFPFKLVISSIGFAPQEIEIKSAQSKVAIQLTAQTYIANEVVVTASRNAEKYIKSPVTIEKLDIRALKESPAPSFYDALANVKGVQLITSSLTFKVPNTRGFNIPNNFRFMQLVDGVDMQAATLGVPLGNAIGPTELDIQSIEITPGASSALYGMNAINGMANLLTKSPFIAEGLSVYQKTGVNHLDGKDHNISLLSETAIRYAKKINSSFAFKINVSYLKGTDWQSNTYIDQNPNTLNTANPAYPQLSGANNPAADLWNRYGDENNNAITVSGVRYGGGNKTFLIRRTGYLEKDLVNPVLDNVKVDAALHYKFNENIELSYAYRLGKMDGVFQRGNKIQLDNVVVQNHQLFLKGEQYAFRAYTSSENTGDSYNLKPLADNLQLTQSSNSVWGSTFKTALQSAIDRGQSIEAAMVSARAAADLGRVEPGTPGFNALKDSIIRINNWDHRNAGIAGAPTTGGAWLKQRSRMYHVEGQWDLSDKIKFMNVLIGADFRLFEVIPDGNNFVDFKRPAADRNKPLADGSFGENVYYKKYGGFVQITKTLFQEKLKLFGSLRIDRNPEFDTKFNPRFAAVYSPGKQHNIRMSYQNGFRFPSLFEALSFVNNGNVRRVGGLSYINNGLGYLDNSYTLASVNTFNAVVNRDVSSGAAPNASIAALNNRNLLEVTNLSATRPERIRSFEVGYKTVLLNNKLNIDVDAYTNIYDGFLGQVEVAVPNTGVIGTDAAVQDMLASNRAKQTRYRVFTNAKNTYRNYGVAFAATYRLYKLFTLSGNFNFNDIRATTKSDIFLTAFNTPKFSTNLSFGNREIIRNIGFNVVWRWQDAFLWESPLAVGKVNAFSTIDAQVTFKLPRYKSSIKIGGANLFNHRYIQYAAGPTIGALYYVAVTVDGLLK